MKVQDWSRLVSFEADIHTPSTLDELKEALLASAGNGPIRVLGGMHSCSRIFKSGSVISTEALPMDITYSDDKSSAVITVNWHLGDLLAELAKHDKSLNATGGEDSQTIAGIISTDTAPATSKVGIYELVDWIEYITLSDDGTAVLEKRVTRQDPEFRAVVCSLGAIGILTRAQFRVIDQPYFKTIQKIIPIKEVLGDVEATSRRYDFWRVNWLPESDDGLLWAAIEIPVDQADPNGDYKKYDQGERLLRNSFMTLAKVGNGGPLLDSFWKKSIFWGLRKTYKEKIRTGSLRRMLPVDRYTPLHVAMAEWFFAPEDLGRAMDVCRSFFGDHKWPNLPVEIELAKVDDYFMSPINWEGRDYVAKCNFQYMTDPCTDKQKERIYAHLHALWNRLVANGVHFKAHWGKINFMDQEWVKSHCQFDEFEPFIRPEFLNEYLTDRLTTPAVATD